MISKETPTSLDPTTQKTVTPVTKGELFWVTGIIVTHLEITPTQEDLEKIAENLGDCIEDIRGNWTDESTAQVIADVFSQILIGKDWNPNDSSLHEELKKAASNRVTEDSSAILPDSAKNGESVDGDLSPEKHPDDVTDDGEWGLDEITDTDALDVIAIDDEPEEGEDFEHIHQILEVELDAPSALLDEDDFTDVEISKLSMIAEGLLYQEVSKILLQDLLQESGPTVRKARSNGPSWWDTKEATEKVANSIAKLLTGSEWPGESPTNTEETGKGYIDNLRELAKIYPLDPDQVPLISDKLQKTKNTLENEPGVDPLEEEHEMRELTDRAKLLGYSTVDERLEFLRNEHGHSSVEFSDSDLSDVADEIEFKFGETPTKTLVQHVASLVCSDDGSIELSSEVSRRIGTSVVELLLGVEGVYPETGRNTRLDLDELQTLIRTYKTEEMTEDEFIAHYDQSRWPAVGATVDLSIFTILDDELNVLLIKRGNHPDKGKWALPGGFVDVNESLDQAAARELQEETGLEFKNDSYLEQVKTYGYPGRDRRGFIVSTLYAALIPEVPAPVAGDDAAEAEFVPVAKVLSGGIDLAFDHFELIRDSYERISAKLEYSPIAMDFIEAEHFSIEDLRRVYEIVWNVDLLPSDFRRRISEAPGVIYPVAIDDPRHTLYKKGHATTIFPPLDRAQVLAVGEEY